MAFGFDANGEVTFDAQELVEIITLPSRQILRDSVTGIARPEVRIDNDTGEIFLTELYSGSFSARFEINVIDSDDEGLKNLGDAEVGGKQTTHILNLVVSDGLIVIEEITQFGQGSITDLAGNTINFFAQSTAQEFDRFENYFVTSATADQSEAAVPEALIEEHGVFLFSFVKREMADSLRTDGTTYFKAYALKIINNQPEIIEHSQQITNDFNWNRLGIRSFYKLYFNHWLAFEENTTSEHRPGGYIFVTDRAGGSQIDNLNTNHYNRFMDIDKAFPDANSTELKELLEVDPDQVLYDPYDSFSSIYGNAAGTTGFFKVYGDGENVTTAVAMPHKRSGEFALNENKFKIFKTNDTVELNNLTYHVLYEIERNHEIGYNFFNQDWTISRVFLCRAPDE